MPHKMSKRQKLAPGQESSATVSFKSVRDASFQVTLSQQPLSTSILDLKRAVAEKMSVPDEKLKLLYKRKPCSDLKALKDLIGAGEREVEFSVMVMGGGATSSSTDAAITGGAAEDGGQEVERKTGGARKQLDSDEFWKALKGFLVERIEDEKESEELLEVFRNAWKGQN